MHGNEHVAISIDSKIAISGHVYEYLFGVMAERKNAGLLIIDSLGNTINFKYKTYSDTTVETQAVGVAATADGGFIIAVSGVGSATSLIRTDENGDTLWTKETISYSDSHLGVFSNGNIACWGNIYDYQGNLLQSNVYAANTQRGVHIGGSAIYDAYSYNDSVVIELNYSIGRTYTNYITGNIYNDLDLDCTKNGLEEGYENVRVQALGSATFFALTDSLGNYSMLVDTGVYTVSLIEPSSYWSSCNVSSIVTISAPNTTDTINMGLQALINCSLLNVDIGAPFIRATGGGSAYTISYCNEGTEDAINANVEVDLDPNLNVLNTSLPIISQVGTIYTFNIGDVAMNDCGSFTMQVVIDTATATLFSQTFCTEAHIYPDSICIPNYWNGPIVEVDVQCLVDTVEFLLENVGSPMGQGQTYYVYEDNVMFRTSNTNVLGNGGTQSIKEQAEPGRTYRIDVAQATGFPPLLGDTIATVAIEGCVLDSVGTFNTGFVVQYPNDNAGIFVAQDCQQGITAYDPNDKSAQPEGYGNAHYINEDTKLNYRVRFQNTGNDTAFLVVVIDTISPFLDPTTIEMGASSHDYTWNLSGQGVLEVRFPNILLVDSITNEPASHGFFYYEIQQNPNNPIGTVINNTAGIYFDFNPPIITNTTYHTVGEDFVTVNLAVGKIYEEKVAVKVFPNPFTHSTTIQVEGKEYETLSLSVFDVTGRLVSQERSAFSNSIQLQNNNLQAGIYFYHLEGEGRLISTGKLMVQ